MAVALLGAEPPKCDNAVPHVTLSTAANVSASYSNVMLAKGFDAVSDMDAGV